MTIEVTLSDGEIIELPDGTNGGILHAKQLDRERYLGLVTKL